MPLDAYTRAGQPMRGTAVATVVLALTILLGTSAAQTVVLFFAPAADTVVSALWLLLYLLAAGGLMLHHGINWLSWVVRYRILLLALLLGAALSVSWSVAPGLSAERVVHLTGASLIAIYLGFMLPLMSLLRVTAVVLGALLLASAAAAVGLPALGLEDYEGAAVWRGLLNSKNTLGFWAAAAVLLYATLSYSEQRLSLRTACVVMALVALGMLAMSRSATSLLSIVIAGGLCLFLFLAHRFRLGFVRMMVMGLVFVGLIALVVVNIDTSDIVGRSEDLTGRAEVWRQTWKLILQRPLTGYGYGAIWFPSDSSLHIQQRLTDFTWVVHHAHNGFLQTASEIGLPLTCLALLMIVQQLIEIVYCQYERRQLGVLFVLGFVVAFLISNISEARFLVHRQLYWIFFLALPISMLRQITLVDTESANAGGMATDTDAPDRAPWSWPERAGAGRAAADGVLLHAYEPEPETAEPARASTIHIQTDIDLGDPQADDLHGLIDLGRRDHEREADTVIGVDTTEAANAANEPDADEEVQSASAFDADDTLDLTHDATWTEVWLGKQAPPVLDSQVSAGAESAAAPGLAETGKRKRTAREQQAEADLEVLDLPDSR